MKNKITIEEQLEVDDILIFRLSERVSEVFIFSDVGFSTNHEPARTGVLYAGPTSGHDAPAEIRQLVDPFYNIEGITGIQIDGNEISFFRDRRMARHDVTPEVVDCIIRVMEWKKDETEVLHEVTSFTAFLHEKGIRLPRDKNWYF